MSIIEEKMVKLFAYNLKGRAFFLWKCQTNIQLRGGGSLLHFIYIQGICYMIDSFVLVMNNIYFSDIKIVSKKKRFVHSIMLSFKSW